MAENQSAVEKLFHRLPDLAGAHSVGFVKGSEGREKNTKWEFTASHGSRLTAFVNEAFKKGGTMHDVHWFDGNQKSLSEGKKSKIAAINGKLFIHDDDSTHVITIEQGFHSINRSPRLVIRLIEAGKVKAPWLKS
jgi:hypothetical protein